MSQQSVIIEKPTRAVWRWLKRLGWISLLLLVLLIVLLLVGIKLENRRGARAWQSYVQEAQAAGESLDSADFIPPPIPDEENFALIPIFQPLFDYTATPAEDDELVGEKTWRDPAAKERFANLRPLTGPSPNVGGNWRKGELADVSGWEKARVESGAVTSSGRPGTELLASTAQFAPELEALRAGTVRPRARFPLHYEEHIAIGFPHITAVLKMSQILHHRVLAELALGDTEAAFQDVQLVLRLAASMRDEPLMLSQLVVIASLEILLREIWEAQARHAWTEAQMSSLENDLAAFNLVATFPRVIRGERAIFLIPGANALKAKPRHLRAMTVLEPIPPFYTSISPWLPAGWLDFNKVRQSQFYQRLLETAHPAAHRIDAQAVDGLEQYLNSSIDVLRNHPHTFLAVGSMSTLANSAQKFAWTQAGLDLARCAIALERHRLKHGTLPEKLDALASEFLPQVPVDVMSGRELVYRREADDRFILYSVGWNGTDDGGAYAWDESARIDWKHGDWAWPQLNLKARAAE